MQYHASHMGTVRARRHYYLPSGYRRSDRVITRDAHAGWKGGRFTLAEGRGERTKPMASSSFSEALNLLGWGSK